MRLELVTGKGGVGKSAITSAIAHSYARQGRRVLTLATTDPRGLGAHLGRQSVSSEAVEIDDGLFLALIASGPALQEYLKTHLNVPTPRMAVATRAFDALATAAPGVKEVITMGKIISEVERGGWDVVVVDAPATGQVAAYLGAPKTVADLVPGGRVREQADRMRVRLADPTTRLTIATLAEELPASETLEALADLDGLCGTTRVVANRVLTPLDLPDLESRPTSPAVDAAQLHQSLASNQQRWLTTLDPAATLPHLFGVLTPNEVAVRLAELVP